MSKRPNFILLDLTDEQMDALRPMFEACWAASDCGEKPAIVAIGQPEDCGEYAGKMRVGFFDEHEARQINVVLAEIKAERAKELP